MSGQEIEGGQLNKCQVFLRISREKVYGSFVLEKNSATGNFMSQFVNWLVDASATGRQSKLHSSARPGAPSILVRRRACFLNSHLPSRWTGRDARNDSRLLLWITRFPDLIFITFFFPQWEYIKDNVCVTPVPEWLAPCHPKGVRGWEGGWVRE